MTVRNADGAQIPVTRTFAWAVLNGSTVVHQGNVAVNQASSFVIPVPALATGIYTLFAAPLSGVCTPFGIAVEPLTDYPGPVLTLRPGRVGTPYSETLTGVVTGVPTAYDIGSGALPAGLTLDPVTGNITGTPTRAGTTKFQVIGRVGAINRPSIGTSKKTRPAGPWQPWQPVVSDKCSPRSTDGVRPISGPERPSPHWARQIARGRSLAR